MHTILCKTTELYSGNEYNRRTAPEASQQQHETLKREYKIL